jgi:hypothetical protein
MGTFRKDWKPTVENQLIVEAYADGTFAKAVASAHGLPAFEYTTPLGEDNRPLGKDGFKEHLRGMRLFVGRQLVKNVAVIADADEDHAAAFTAVRRAFSDAGGFPTITHAGTVVPAQGLRVGALVLPGGNKKRLLRDAPTGCDAACTAQFSLYRRLARLYTLSCGAAQRVPQVSDTSDDRGVH